MIDSITILTQLQFYKCLQDAVKCVPPVKVDLLIIVSVMQLPIDRTLTAPLPTIRQQLEESLEESRGLFSLLSTIRQQLEEAKAVPRILSCTSTATQLNLTGWT